VESVNVQVEAGVNAEQPVWQRRERNAAGSEAGANGVRAKPAGEVKIWEA